MSFFTPREDGAFEPSELTRGPWEPDAQHAGPPAALLARAIERCGDGAGRHVARITLEVLSPVPITTLTASAQIARPGRSVELLEGTLASADGPVMRATAWRIRTEQVEVGDAADLEPPAHGPDDGRAKDFFPTGADVGYHTAMEGRFVSGSFLELGPAVVWMRMRHPLVEGEEPSPLQRVLVAADSGNGVSAALDWRRHLFINTDLSVHLYRYPATEWVCLDAVTRLGPDGIGMADTLLWDERGRIGRGLQAILVRERV